jgi:hypothetical protein
VFNGSLVKAREIVFDQARRFLIAIAGGSTNLPGTWIVLTVMMSFWTVRFPLPPLGCCVLDFAFDSMLDFKLDNRFQFTTNTPASIYQAAFVVLQVHSPCRRRRRLC